LSLERPNYRDPQSVVDELTQNTSQGTKVLFASSNLDDFFIRLATMEDVPALRMLLNAAYKQLADSGLNFTAAYQDDAGTAHGIEKGRTFVLELADRLVATVRVRIENLHDDHHCLYISRFGVLPELQGHGIGLRLLHFAEHIARREGYPSLRLDTAKPAEHLVRFYQSQGFQIVGPIQYEGKTYSSWILEKYI